MTMVTEAKNREFEEALPLVLTSVTGQTLWSFPGEVIENLRSLVTRIGKKGEFPARLSLVAALRGEGVTYIAQALAAILANDLSAKVCLVDLNWWWPSSTPLVASDSPGAAAVLTGEANLADVILTTGWSNLAFVPAGRLARQDRPIMSHSQALKLLIDELGSRFDYLILDIPAILATNDAVPLASLGSACCLVVRQGETPINNVQSALDEIDHLSVLGAVLNRVKFATPPGLVKLVS
jgi:Mrp family chromosome partitioning ATPase